MDETIQNARLRTKEDRYTRYWATKLLRSVCGRLGDLSVEKYGPPKSLLDGPFRRIRRNASGEEEPSNSPHSHRCFSAENIGQSFQPRSPPHN